MALPNKLNDARELLEARSVEMKTFVEKLQKEGSTVEQRDELKKRNDELGEINDHVMSLHQVEIAAKSVADIEAKQLPAYLKLAHAAALASKGCA